jgi:hypothetical protein
MAGQGRNADGLTGSDPSDAPNVVRFPGDWFGPLTDLVPIDTGTDGDAEPDGPDLYADDAAGTGADSFWSEDAQDVHRLSRPAHEVHGVGAVAHHVHRVGVPESGVHSFRTASPLSAFLRRSPAVRLAVPIGGFAALAAVAVISVTGVLGSGVEVAKPGNVAHVGHRRAAGTELAAAPRVGASSRTTRSAKPKPRVHERSHRVAHARHTPARRAPASAGPRPPTDAEETQVDTVVAANTPTGDVASPTGVVAPPPNATQPSP